MVLTHWLRTNGQGGVLVRMWRWRPGGTFHAPNAVLGRARGTLISTIILPGYARKIFKITYGKPLPATTD